MEELSSSSMISNANKMDAIAEVSDSYYSNYTFRASKRPRHDRNANAAKFKGVVPQQNGSWGAQIYANHQRIWLGTFKSEKDAAMAYDSAAIKLRSGDSYRNFPWTVRNVQEPNFQSQYSAEAILNMIRNGSYQPEFADFLRAQSEREAVYADRSTQGRVHGNRQFTCVQLFQKELTPSDVGKLNRLVIPKKFAVKYFPHVCENVEDDQIGAGRDDMELVFYDRLMKSWKFRYCYWRSSQSFVFTRGWNMFVKEKNLKEKDVVTFYACACQDQVREGQHFSLIDVTPSNNQSSAVDHYGKVNQIEEMQKELELSLGQTVRRSNKLQNCDKREVKDNEKGLRLFGVRIK